MSTVLRSILLLFLLGQSLQNFSQEEKVPTFQIGVKGAGGFIIAHNSVMQYLTSQHVSKLELYLEKNTFGGRAWNERYGFPRIGISFSYFNLNNDKQLGKAFSLYPYLNIRVFGREKFLFRFKPGLGMGYIEKPFDAENNFKNIAIGSHINIFFSFLFESEWRINKNLGISLGANFHHFSNTGFKSPNLGINIPTLEAGVFHRFKNEKEKVYWEEGPFKADHANWRVSMGVGFNEVGTPGGEKYMATLVSIERENRVGYKSAIGGSLDLFYNPGQRKMLANDSIFIKKGWETGQAGISIFHNMYIGKAQQFIKLGYYLKTSNENLGNLYQIVGGKIPISEKINSVIVFKTHYAKAEYIMIGIELKIK